MTTLLQDGRVHVQGIYFGLISIQWKDHGDVSDILITVAEEHTVS